MYCALELDKALTRGLDAEVILVNKENFFLFTPMLHEVADFECCAAHRGPLLTIVVAGGGFPCQKERGRICVNEYLEVAGWPGVWSLGDCACVPDLATGKTCPLTAQHALRQGRVLERNIVASIRGGEKKPFRFRTLGALAAIGRRTGVAQIFGFQFSGFIAWWMWQTIYLSKLPRFEKKLRVALDWTLDLLFSKDLVQFQTLRTKGVSHAESPARRLEEAKA